MQTNSFKSRVVAGVAAALLISFVTGMPTASHAGNKGANKAANQALAAAAKAAPKYNGTITNLNTTNEAITISGKKKVGTLTFTVSSTTIIRTHGEKGKLAFGDLTLGEDVTVHSADKVAALEIVVHPPVTSAATPAASPAPGA